MNDKNQLVVGWFSFTCCEGCLILLTELLNDNLDNWKKLIEFRHLKALKTKNSLKDLDIAFVEGAISSPTQEVELKTIRDNCKHLVAIGSCATTGKPSASRNEFISDELNYKILWYFEKFKYNEYVKKIEDIVKVDAKVPGCPMNGPLFIKAVESFLKLYKLI
jgi:coenzyme F420-reducing hydrogenase gamma subunit